jgi:hypothetical protein
MGKVRNYPLNNFFSKRESMVVQCCSSSTSGNSVAKGFLQKSMSRMNEIVPMQRKSTQSSAILFAVSRRFLSSSHAGHPQGLQNPDSSTAPDVAAELLQSSSLENVFLSTSLDPVPTGWSPAALAEFGIVAIHDAFGLPWCLSIAGITVVLRAVLFPLVVYQVGDVLVCNTVVHGFCYVCLIHAVASLYQLKLHT